MVEFLNFAEPLVGEAYINFHMLGVVFVLFLVGLLAARADAFFKSWCHFNTVNTITDPKVVLAFPPRKVCVYLVCLGWFLFVLRGDLMSALSFISGILISLIFTYWLVSKRVFIKIDREGLTN